MTKQQMKVQGKQVAKQFWQIYNVYDFIDAKDSQGDWRVGYIIQKNINTRNYKVRFDGWGSKYDEYYRFTSPKLSHFRSIVIGYTGQKKNPAIRSDWKFNIKSHQKMVQMFEDFSTSKQKSALEINQFFRGHNYLYTDFLMCDGYQSYQQFAAIMQYLLSNVKLVINYLKNIDPQFKKYYRSHENVQESHLSDPESAMANAFYELMDTLYTVSGSYTRLQTFFSKNTSHLRKYLNVDFEKQPKRYYQLKVLQEVLKQQGFAVMQQLISEKLQNSKCVIPFLFLKSLVALYHGLSNQIQYKEKKKYLDMLVQITKNNLSKLDDKYMKDLNKTHVVDLLQTLKNAYELTEDQQTIRNWALQEQVMLYQKMVACPYFDKKLKGVIGFQQLAQKNKMQPYASFFIQTLLKYKIFDSLFLADNAEIIKKSVEFCKSLCFNELFPQEIAFRIWQLRQGKHEAALQQIYSLISVLPSKFNHSQFQKKLFDVISSQPKQLWDQDYIKMIKQYSLAAVGWVTADQKVVQKYGLNILFANVILRKTDFSIANFIQLLTRFQKTEVMTNFITQCFQKISQNQDSYIYVVLLLKIIQQNLTQLKQAPQNSSNTIIKDLLNNSNDSLQKSVKRFQLLNQVAKLTSVNVALQEFMSLWKQFKKKPSEKALHDWILNKKDGQRASINIKIGTDIRRDIFQQIWSQNYDYTQISEKQSQLFIQFFKATNVSAGKLKRFNVIIKTQNLDLIGLEKVWKAFLSVKNQKIALNLAQLITEVHMVVAKSSEDSREEWIKRLITQFSKKIFQAYKKKDMIQVKRLLMIPSKIIERDEQIFVTKPGKNYIMKQYKVINKSTKQQKLIKFNIGALTYDFKKAVAQKFKIPFKKCRLSCKGELIKSDNYFKSLVECASSSPFQLQIIQDEIPSVKKYLNTELQIFFTLLSDPQLQRNVWEIIQRLPIAEDELRKLEHSQQPWQQINNASIYKQLYMMRVMGYMDKEWWKQFCKGPGFYNLSMKFQRITAKAKVQRQYLKILCQSLQQCLEIEPEVKQINFESLVLSMLKSLNDVLQCSAQQSHCKRNSVEASIVSSIFNILKKLSGQGNFMKIFIQKYDNKLSLLSKGLITVRNEFVRKQFMNKLKQASHYIPSQNIQEFLSIIYNKLFQLATNYTNYDQTTQYFEYASEFIGIVKNQDFTMYLLNSNNQLIKLVERGLHQQKHQVNTQSLNHLLVGYLMLMKKLIVFSSQDQKARITNFILYKCFFPHFDNQNTQVLCKCKQSKTAAFDLLVSLLKEDKNSLPAIDILASLHKNALWRTRKIDDWTLTPGEKIKSASGYVGLKNLGCICYMNSLFQQIFMIPSFRQAILQCQDPLQDKQIEQQNVLYQIKKMFYSLLNSDTKYYIPAQFCHAFKNYEGQPTNVYEQMDIDQFSNILFDRLETQIKSTPYENIIKDFFGGVFSNQIICKGCPHFSETQQSFLSISLNVKTKKNIYQSFDAMIKGDTLDGDNAYFCERCNKKVSAVKRVCLKKLPDYLILTLKRFEFDYQTMNKLKLNDYCQFPTQLNVKQYSQQYLRKQQNPDRFEDEQILQDSYYDYNLQGVVIHIGHADSGHYFSYIKQRKNEGRWFEFNDTNVRPFDIRKLAQQAFGGQMGTIQVKQKIKNAYMLIYERKKKLVDHSKLLNEQKKLQQIPIYASLKQSIQHQNLVQKIESILFSTQYTKFASNLLKNIEQMEPLTAVTTLKYIIQVYLTVTIRQKQQGSAFQFLKGINKILPKYSNVREWLIQIFTAQKSFLEFFKNNPAKNVRKLLAHWLADTAKSVPYEKQHKFIDGLLGFMAFNNQNYPQFCQILFELMSDNAIVQYAIRKHTLGILLQNVLGKEGKQKSHFKSGQDLSIVESAQELIGKQVLIEKTPHQLNKKIKPLQETPYVWGVIARIIQYAQKLQKPLDQIVDKLEIELMYLPMNKIYTILQQCKGKFMINKFCILLTYLAKQNQKVSQQIMNLGIMGLKEFLSKRYRQFFIMLNRMAKIEDKFAQQRNKKALDFMVKALKENQKYTFDSSIIQQWIIKSVRKNKRFQALLQQNQQCLKYLTEFTTKKQPAEDVCRKNHLFQETSVNKFHGIKMMRSKKGYEILGKKMQRFFIDIAQQKQIINDGWSSDQDLTEKQVEVGDTIAYFDSKDKIEFLQSKVDEVLLSRLWVSANKTRMPAVWKDDQILTSKNYSFQDLDSDDELVDSQNTTQMEYDDDYMPPGSK